MLRRFVLLVAIAVVAVPAVAQDATDAWSDVKISDLLSTATVLDETVTEWSGEVVQLDADGLDLVQANGKERHFSVAQIRRLETTGRDSIKNGGLIGAGLGAGAGIAMAAAGGVGESCSLACLVYVALINGGLWGAVGLTVDFITPNQRRLTLYQAAGTSSGQRHSFGGRGPSTPMTLTATIRW